MAAAEWITGYVPGDTNTPDVLTKPVLAGKRRTRLVRGLMYDI